MNDSTNIEFARQFTKFVSNMGAVSAAAEEPPVFRRKLEEFFDGDTFSRPVMVEQFAAYNHPNVQRALEAFIEHQQCEVTALGFASRYDFMQVGLSALITGMDLEQAPVLFEMYQLGNAETVTAYNRALLFIRGKKTKLAVVVNGPTAHATTVKIEIMAEDRTSATEFLDSVNEYILTKNAYRGKIISVAQDEQRQVTISVHNLPQVKRKDIILQSGILEQVEKLTIQFADRVTMLKKAKRHIKRGLLLYGPPGTGKTYTAMYLAQAMKERTVLMASGLGLGLLETTVSLARSMAPSMVVLEDVDLIGEERSHQTGCTAPLLFELLNQMDGMASDIDVIFLLTTNRPDVLEPALASRPGRIDQAIEIPLPDAMCRRKLFKLYGNGLNVTLQDRDSLISRTEGASAAFIKELFRRAALFGEENQGGITITDKNLDDALHELITRGGQLTQSLLGFQVKPVGSRRTD